MRHTRSQSRRRFFRQKAADAAKARDDARLDVGPIHMAPEGVTPPDVQLVSVARFQEAWTRQDDNRADA